jgi:DNA-binding NarL/FixJ family response regulator
MKNESEKLSVIEQAILRMIVGEMTDNEIAFALDISDEKLEKYLANIFVKLKVSDKIAAKDVAIKLELVRIEV